MIYEVEGDIILSRAQVIVQSVSTRDAMTQGIARKLHERFPTMVEDFNKWCETEGAEPGQIWLWGNADKKFIINLLTHQGDDDPRRVGRPDKIALNHCFKALSRLYAKRRFTSLAMPMIGAGEGGLDWFEVEGMLHAQLGDLLIPIFVYLKQLDGQLAYEPGL